MPASRVTGAPDAAPVPAEFREVVEAIEALRVRPEIELSELPSPQRLAPHSHALAATVHDTVSDEEIGSGRFVILYDPEGVETWGGTLRFVVFASCDVEGEIARDPLLPDVGWSWLNEALAGCGAEYTALGGTVTATSSVRFGDIAATDRSDDVEIRASWTGIGGPWAGHLTAFIGLLAAAAGLPPEGVAPISPIRAIRGKRATPDI
jgi:hypothetical protein